MSRGDRSSALRLFDPQGIRRARSLEPDHPARRRLHAEAIAALGTTPLSVMDKPAVPPSGNKHDYMSMGPYWWPNPDAPDGLPYVRRDGQVNPEGDELDRSRLHLMAACVETLSLSFAITGDADHGRHAARLLRVWFLDDATRMNPNLNYGQAVPGKCHGRGIGIIDTLQLCRLCDAVTLLAPSRAWQRDDTAGMRDWFGRYLHWLLDSALGRDEAATRNNHGTWYDAQVSAFALFVGKVDVAREVLSQVPDRRITVQIEPDGRQPHELSRTRSLSYSMMNLRGFMTLAQLGQVAGVNLWGYASDDGRGIRAAAAFLLPYLTGERVWEHQQITPVDGGSSAELFRLAAIHYGDKSFEQAISKLADVDRAAMRINLTHRQALTKLAGPR